MESKGSSVSENFTSHFTSQTSYLSFIDMICVTESIHSAYRNYYIGTIYGQYRDHYIGTTIGRLIVLLNPLRNIGSIQGLLYKDYIGTIYRV